MTSLKHQHELLVALVTYVTSIVPEHGRQCMPCSANLSMTLQTDIVSTETSYFLKQIIFLKSFNYVFEMAKCFFDSFSR